MDTIVPEECDTLMMILENKYNTTGWKILTICMLKRFDEKYA